VHWPKLHFVYLLWICCGLVADLLYNLFWTCRNVHLLQTCYRRCSKLVLLYICCVFHLVDNQLVLVRTVYSQTQGCVCTALQLGGDVEQPWLISKYDVIHKTGSTLLITTPPEEDRATAIGNMHIYLVKTKRVVPKI